MTIIGKQLADGQLANAEADLYVCPAGTRVFIKSIICTNVHAANSNTIRLYLKPSAGTSRRLCNIPLAYDEQLFFNEPIVLDAADAIRGYATNATEVDYVIDGATEVV